MARPAGSSKKEKAASAAPPAGRILEDQTTLSNLTESTFHEHIKAIQKLTTEKDTANANLRNAWKLAEEAGIDREMAKFALKVKKKDDDLRKGQFKTLDSYLKWLRTPTGTQLGLYQEEAPLDEPAAIAKAEDDGAFAYHENKNLTANPHAINTPRGQAWQKGYLDAEAGVIHKMAPASKTVETQPKAH